MNARDAHYIHLCFRALGSSAASTSLHAMHDGTINTLRHTAVLLAFAALSLAMTWPLGANLATHVVHAKWHYDSMVNIHILGSRLHYALGLSDSLASVYDNYFCAPTPFSITNNESHFGLSLLYAPLFIATSDPLLSYNLLLLLCMTLSGFFTYLLVRELSGSALAGVLSGVAYAFCPYVFFELGRIQLVAAQWIPLFAIFLHRAATTGSLGALLGLALTFAMQIGCCLYYAMFLIVYGVFVGAWLVVRNRLWTRTFALRLAAAGLVAGVLVAPMVYPYFRARQDFGQVRSKELSSRYSGKLADLAKVYPENKALSFMHDKAEGPAEPIAFPGFTLLLLAAVAALAPIVRALRSAEPKDRNRQLRFVLLAVAAPPLAVAASFVAHSFLAGLLVVIASIMAWRRLRSERLLPPLTAVYVALLALAVALYLGPVPFEHGGAEVHGLYYYLYRYAPGFDGIRYVSRFAVLIMLALAVLAGFGATLLLRGPRGARLAGFTVLLCAMLLELRNAPVTLARLPSKSHLPPVYEWLARHPGPEPIATIPAYTMGYYGARNDYFALFHRRRTIDGKSSWMPPVTYTHIYETRRFPRSSGMRLLQTLGAKYLVLHTEEMRDRAARVLRWLDGRPESYQRRFASGEQYVYEILPSKDSSLTLLSTPKIPEAAVLVPRTDLDMRAGSAPTHVRQAIDGDTASRWESGRNQHAGMWFELHLRRARELVALELTDYEDAFEAPAAFRLSVTDPDGKVQVVMERPLLRYYYDQVYHPRTFAFRIVLPRPVLTQSVRVELLDGVAGRRLSIHEAKLWAAR